MDQCELIDARTRRVRRLQARRAAHAYGRAEADARTAHRRGAASPRARMSQSSVTTRSGEPTSADSAADRHYIVRPSVLEAQMKALQDAGYTPITGDAYVAHMLRGAKLPRKPILLTFDDASAGQYTQRAADPQRAPLRRHVLRDDGRARQAGLADQGPGAGARPRGDDDRRPHLRPQGGPAVHGRRLEDAARPTRVASCARSSATRSRSSPTPYGAYSAEAIQPMFTARLPRRVPARRQARPRAPAVEHPPDHRAGDDRQAAPARDPAGLSRRVRT